MAKDISDYSADKKSDAIIERTFDMHVFTQMMKIGFGEGTAEIFAHGHTNDKTQDNRAFFLAKDSESNEVVGIGAAFYHDNVAYMSCLAVKPEYRKRNIAKDLVKARINFLKENGVNYIITAVNESNGNSLKVQKSAGYLPCAITEYWTK